MSDLSEDIKWMQVAISEAREAAYLDEVPVGAVLVGEDGIEIARSHNLKEMNFDPCDHAEIICIKKAAKELQNWRLENCTLYVTLEPCAMCLGAMVHSRIKRLVFGAYDKKGGAISLGYNMFKDRRLNHNFDVTGGLLHYDCASILSNYFKSKRKNYKSQNMYNA